VLLKRGVLPGTLVAGLLILTVVGFTPGPRAGTAQGSPAASDGTPSDLDDAIARGAVVYRRACSACHGRDGKGDGPGAAELNPWPRDFTVGKYRIRSTLSGEPPRREDIEGAIRDGMPGSTMPAWKGLLSDRQISDVLSFILSLGPDRLSGPDPDALTIPEFPDIDPTRLSDGRAIYLIVGCWKCHGINATGDGPSAKGLKTDEGQKIRPRNLRYDPFKGGRSPENVSRIVLSGHIGTPMPAHAEILVIPQEAISAFTEAIPPEVRPELEEFSRKAPSASYVVNLEDDVWLELQQENLVSLVQYVLSLDRRDRYSYRLFRKEPELEGRKTPEEAP